VPEEGNNQQGGGNGKGNGQGRGNGKGRQNGQGGGSKGKGNNKGKGKGGPADHNQKHTNPGGSGAILGARIAKYTGFQGISLVLSNILHAASIIYVAHRLGPTDLGTYTLLLFISGLITQVFHIFSKPGTLRRTFGQADDDDGGSESDFGGGKEGDDKDETVSESPQKSLGNGILWASLLGLVGGGLCIIFRVPIAESVMGSADKSEMVLWAGILGGVAAVFKLCDIIIWFERRPITFIIVDASRPLFNLILMAWFIHEGEGVLGAIKGAAIGTCIATVISVLALVRSFELSFTINETKQIIKRGFARIPIAMSMWIIQNADTFLLSRYVDHKQVGYYSLAQKLGYVVSFLPQGFRIAMRPLRKSAMFDAVKAQYGSAIARGQLMAYFCLVSMIAIVTMVMGGTLIVNQASAQFQAAAPLIPFTAAAMTMPALFRTVSGQVDFPKKRYWWIGSVVLSALTFAGWIAVLVPRIGIIGTPIASILAFGIPCAAMFIRNQRGPNPVHFPYRAIVTAALSGAAFAFFFKFVHFDNKWIQLAEIGGLMLLYFGSFFFLGVIPKYHRAPLWHIAKTALRRKPHGFDRDAGLGALNQNQRRLLQDAVVNRVPVEVFTHDGSEAAATANGGSEGNGDGAINVGNGDGAVDVGNGAGTVDVNPVQEDHGHLHAPHLHAPHLHIPHRHHHDAGPASKVPPERLVKILRKAGQKGGVPVGETTEYDERIAKYLFADAPTAARNATMKTLVSSGADSNDLRALEDLVEYLAHTPKSAWGGDGKRHEERAAAFKEPV
jgi:O-antigen/teichoic acid export membrane protein